MLLMFSRSSFGLWWPVSIVVDDVVVDDDDDVGDVSRSSSRLGWPVSIGLNKNLYRIK